MDSKFDKEIANFFRISITEIARSSLSPEDLAKIEEKKSASARIPRGRGRPPKVVEPQEVYLPVENSYPYTLIYEDGFFMAFKDNMRSVGKDFKFSYLKLSPDKWQCSLVTSPIFQHLIGYGKNLEEARNNFCKLLPFYSHLTVIKPQVDQNGQQFIQLNFYDVPVRINSCEWKNRRDARWIAIFETQRDSRYLLKLIEYNLCGIKRPFNFSNIILAVIIHDKQSCLKMENRSLPNLFVRYHKGGSDGRVDVLKKMISKIPLEQHKRIIVVTDTSDYFEEELPKNPMYVHTIEKFFSIITEK